jgi:hypothetical protein
MKNNEIQFMWSTKSLSLLLGTVQAKEEEWYTEYLTGASGEIYLIPINYEFAAKFQFQWTLMVEAVYLEYGCMMLAVVNIRDQNICLNPDASDFSKFASSRDFFDYYNIGVIIAEEQLMASAISTGTTDVQQMWGMLSKVVNAESQFAVRVGLSTGSFSGKKREKFIVPAVSTSNAAPILSSVNLSVMGTQKKGGKIEMPNGSSGERFLITLFCI